MPMLDGDIVQICFIVPDLDKAVETWLSMYGAGPFFVMKNMDDVKIEYRGKPATMNISVALGQAGAVQVELIEVVGTNPSVYQDMYQKGQGGFHHIALYTDGITKKIDQFNAAGHALGARGDFNGTAFAYVDTRAATGFFTELYENTDSMHEMYRKIAAAAKNWDGKNPVRPLTDVL